MNAELMNPPATSAAAAAAGVATGAMFSAADLGSREFRDAYRLKYAYLAGAMYKGVASKELVIAMGRAGLMGFLGTGGLKLEQVDADVAEIRRQLPPGAAYGLNLLHAVGRPEYEQRLVELCFKHGVRNIEAAAFMTVTPALVCYRLKGARRLADGTLQLPHHLMAKVSRPEVAAEFMAAPPADIVQQLLAQGLISAEEAALAPEVVMAGEICVEADSAGHTDQGVALVLLPAMQRLRDELVAVNANVKKVRIGAAGGIGSPEAAAAAFMLGADFIVTGSINQCTVEAGTSDAVKDLLQAADIQDTDYAPAGDMFELGAKVQVLKKGLFFAARANKLYELWARHGSIDEIDAKTRNQIESRFFKRSFEEVWQETRAHHMTVSGQSAEQLEANAKRKMALIFRWYFTHSSRLALAGSAEQKVDYQIHCGPAMGAFNRWVKGSEIESWRNRRVAQIGERLMQHTAQLMSQRLQLLQARAARA